MGTRTTEARNEPQVLPFIQLLRYKNRWSASLRLAPMYRIAMRHIATLTALLLSVAALAQTPPASPAPNATKTGIDAVLGARSNGDDFLPADKAFRFDATADGSDRVRLNWEIADGYYLYRARIKVSTTSTAAQLGPTEFPPGQIKSTSTSASRRSITTSSSRACRWHARAAASSSCPCR